MEDQFYSFGDRIPVRNPIGDFGVYDNIDDGFLPPVGGSSALPPVGVEGGYTNGDDQNLEDAFAITVNGSIPVDDDDGNPVYSTSVSLDCNAGKVILFEGETGNLIDHVGSFEALFSVDDGFTAYGVYGKVIYSTSEANNRLTPSTFVSGSIEIEDTETVSGDFKDGWRKDPNNSGQLIYMFQIGHANLKRDGNDRRIRVTQIQMGDHHINFKKENDDDGVDVGDGLREVILCVNGEPYNALIDVRSMSKVT